MNVWTKILQIYELRDINLDCAQYFIGSGEGGPGGCVACPQTKSRGAESPRFWCR